MMLIGLILLCTFPFGCVSSTFDCQECQCYFVSPSAVAANCTNLKLDCIPNFSPRLSMYLEEVDMRNTTLCRGIDRFSFVFNDNFLVICNNPLSSESSTKFKA